MRVNKKLQPENRNKELKDNKTAIITAEVITLLVH